LTQQQRARVEREIRRDIEKHDRENIVRRLSKRIAPLTPEMEAQIAADIVKECKCKNYT
jgi:FixJ family two-component response regulator